MTDPPEVTRERVLERLADWHRRGVPPGTYTRLVARFYAHVTNLRDVDRMPLWAGGAPGLVRWVVEAAGRRLRTAERAEFHRLANEAEAGITGSRARSAIPRWEPPLRCLIRAIDQPEAAATELVDWAGRDDRPSAGPDGRAVMLRLMDCLHPVRRVDIDPRWRTADVLGIARGIYEDRAFSRMPVLGDALMDAGCDDPVVLGHCRGGGVHARGCWLVDLLTGRG